MTVAILPDLPNGKKAGVDDRIAAGDTKAVLESYRVDANQWLKQQDNHFKTQFMKERSSVDVTWCPPSSTAAKAEIVVSDRQLDEVSDEFVQVLHNANQPPEMFLFDNRLVNVKSKPEGGATIEHQNVDKLRHKISRCASFFSFSKGHKRPTVPPPDIVRDVLSRTDLPFPRLEGVIFSPVLREDGTLLVEPGYDEKTKLFFAPSQDYKKPCIPEHVTPEKAKCSLNALLELLYQFPFHDECSLANALGLCIASFVRPAISGPCPLGLISSTQQGSGKGLLAQTITLIATGEHPKVTLYTNRDEELDKRLTATLMKSPILVQFDDVSVTMDSAVLASAITARNYEGRILGQSEMVSSPVNALWIATGNNIKCGGDIARRCYLIRFSPQQNAPWMRSGFRFPQLAEFVAQRRFEIIEHILTLCRAWFCAGCPEPETPLLGSFESWTHVVGGILEYAGIRGFLANGHVLHEESDVENNEWEVFFTAWAMHLGKVPVSVDEVVQKLASKSLFREAIPSDILHYWDKESTFRQQLGFALRKREERRHGAHGWRVLRAGTNSHSKVALWRVEGTSEDELVYQPLRAGKEGIKESNPEALKEMFAFLESYSSWGVPVSGSTPLESLQLPQASGVEIQAVPEQETDANYDCLDDLSDDSIFDDGEQSGMLALIGGGEECEFSSPHAYEFGA